MIRAGGTLPVLRITPASIRGAQLPGHSRKRIQVTGAAAEPVFFRFVLGDSDWGDFLIHWIGMGGASRATDRRTTSCSSHGGLRICKQLTGPARGNARVRAKTPDRSQRPIDGRRGLQIYRAPWTASDPEPTVKAGHGYLTIRQSR